LPVREDREQLRQAWFALTDHRVSGLQVKEAMLRSANEGIAQLTAALEDAQRDACDAAAAAARTEKDAAARHSEAGHRQRALR
jgi:hypothetical protein